MPMVSGWHCARMALERLSHMAMSVSAEVKVQPGPWGVGIVLKWAFATAGLVHAGRNTPFRSLSWAMFALTGSAAASVRPGDWAQLVVPNTAPVANIPTPPRRNVWREILRSSGRLRFIVMSRILAGPPCSFWSARTGAPGAGRHRETGYGGAGV